MGFSRTGLLLAALSTVVLAGCQGSRLGSLDSGRPAPLTAAPSGTVSAQPLPPPAPPTGPTDPSSFPPPPTTADATAPGTPGAPGTTGTQVAAAPPNAPDITTGSVAGVWNLTVAGQPCKIATSLTKLGSHNRAAPLRCAAPVDGVKAWNVEGKQLSLYDQNGSVVARFYSSGAERFDGQTSGGLPISLSR